MSERYGWDRGRRIAAGIPGQRLGWDKRRRTELVVWAGIISALRVSSVNGTAFVDNLPAAVTDLVAASPGLLRLEALDPFGNVLAGVLSAVGTVETYTEQITGDNVTFASDTGWWTKQDGSVTIGSGKASFTNSTGKSLYKTGFSTKDKLLKFKIDVTAFTAGDKLQFTTGGALWGAAITGPVTNYTEYRSNSSDDGNINIRANSGVTASVDNFTCGIVLSPTASGALIVSTKQGAVRNWTTNNWTAGSYNAATNQVRIIKLI